VFRGLFNLFNDRPITMSIDVLDLDGSDVEHKIGNVSISITGFKRGVLEYNWYGIGEKGLIRIGIQPHDFGDISLPDHISTRLNNNSMYYISESETKIHSNRPNSSRDFNLINFEDKDIERKKCIAAGTFGVVYKCKVKNFSEIVVVKDMNIEEDDSVTSWKKEIEIMAQNKSRYITNIIGYCYSHKTLSIVMEYVKRKSLFDILHNKKVSLSLLHRIRMSRHCLRGLVWLHGKNIAHRDVKSLNILVTEDYSCKLSDFGSAKLYLITFNTPNVGSKLWMAPEVKTNDYEPKASDIWSMGIVLYEILTGILPAWNEEEELAIIPTDEDYIGKKIISRCVVRDPETRPLSFVILEALDSWIESILTSIYMSDIKEKKIDKMRRENDNDIIELYNYLVNKNPYRVDELLTKVNGLPEPQFKNVDLYSNNFFKI